MLQTDGKFMAEAIELSAHGFPAPNPRVGAVIANDGAVIGRGWHESAGMPHAEIVALEAAGHGARGADLFVTLEPCSHQGKTPPCVDAIIAAGVKRVVFAVRDPNPDAAGGAEKLEKAGIQVEHGFGAQAAAAMNRVFLSRWRHGRPFVQVKAAITLDGRIADKQGRSQWITDETARARAQTLRAEMGCVLVGAGTVEKDNPSLTVRLPNFHSSQPLRVVIDPFRRLGGGSKVFSDGAGPTLHVIASKANAENEWECPMQDGQCDLDALLGELARRGVIGVLVEGGGKTIEPFFRAHLVDAVELHVAPKLFGAGLLWIDGPGVASLPDAWRIANLRSEPLGDGIRVWGEVER